MSVKERILTIRLIDKVRANPATAEKVGIEVASEIHNVGNIRQKMPVLDNGGLRTWNESKN